MNFKLEKRATGIAITALLITVVAINVLIIILAYFIPEGDGLLGGLLTQLLRIRIDFSMLVLVLVFIIAIMHVNEFKKVRSGNYENYDYALIALFFIGLSSALMMADAYIENSYILVAPTAVIISGFVGKKWMPVIVALITSVPTLIVYANFYDALILLYTLVPFIIVGLVSGFICRNGYSRKTAKIGFAFNVALIIISAVSFTSYYDYNTTNIIVDTALSIAFSFVAIYVYDRNITIVDSADEGRRAKDELAIAHNIQVNAIPRKFEHSSLLEYHGMMESAIEMSGDFYDCFEIKKNLTVITVADVSDKGLVAALFMMKSKATFKSIAMIENNPEKILEAANNELCDGNDANQFVTAWIGIIDSDTGMLYYSDAGHTVPYIKRKNGKCEPIEEEKGMVLGVFDGVEYRRNSVKLSDGDMVFAYTDGVNEAMNPNGEQYGHERLVSILDSFSGTCEETIAAVREDVRKFASGSEMSDDITMFCLKAKRGNVHEIKVKAVEENLDEVVEFVESNLVKSGCPDYDAKKIDVVTEEIFVNICANAYQDKEGDVAVFCRFENGEIKLTFEDSGIKFDPVQRSEIVISKNVADWSIGGFGIHMVKKLVDAMEYKRVCDTNVFTVRKKVSQSENQTTNFEIVK